MLEPAVAPPLPPGEDDLPYEDGDPVESDRHRVARETLVNAARRWLLQNGRTDVYVAANMAIYFNQLQVLRNDFRAPDVFLVLDTVVRERKSWVVWAEGQAPNMVIELVSPSTEDEDRGRKKRAYARALKVPLYCIYDPFSARLDAYVLDPFAADYVDAPRGPDGAVPAPLGLELAVWEGDFQGLRAPWLRWREAGGAWLPTGDEAAVQEAEHAQQESARAAHEAARAAAAQEDARRLRARLAAMGIPEE